jgi:UDP:flavonoid glycosyltransferase YjiC (YdhE family)
VRLLGAGPAPIPLGGLTARRLAAAINQALGDEAMRDRCRALGKKIDAENGVDRAVERMTRELL